MARVTPGRVSSHSLYMSNGRPILPKAKTMTSDPISGRPISGRPYFGALSMRVARVSRTDDSSLGPGRFGTFRKTWCRSASRPRACAAIAKAHPSRCACPGVPRVAGRPVGRSSPWKMCGLPFIICNSTRQLSTRRKQWPPTLFRIPLFRGHGLLSRTSLRLTGQLHGWPAQQVASAAPGHPPTPGWSLQRTRRARRRLRYR